MYELDLINYQNKCKLIRGWDDLFTKVKEHINSVTAMKLSPFFKVRGRGRGGEGGGRERGEGGREGREGERGREREGGGREGGRERERDVVYI